MAPGLLHSMPDPWKKERNESMYDVCVDRAALREEVLGPLFQRHLVSLTGTIDEQWLASFEEVAKDSDVFQRFRLDQTKGIVSFTCRASDGPQVVESFLERLTLFVEMVNLAATCAGATESATSSRSASA
jgi:hypothetical protein